MKGIYEKSNLCTIQGSREDKILTQLKLDGHLTVRIDTLTTVKRMRRMVCAFVHIFMVFYSLLLIRSFILVNSQWCNVATVNCLSFINLIPEMWNKPDSRVLDVNVSLLKRLILFVELFLIRLVARGTLPGASPFFIFLLVRWLVLDLDLDTSDGLRKGWYDSGKVWSDKDFKVDIRRVKWGDYRGNTREYFKKSKVVRWTLEK